MVPLKFPQVDSMIHAMFLIINLTSFNLLALSILWGLIRKLLFNSIVLCEHLQEEIVFLWRLFLKEPFLLQQILLTQFLDYSILIQLILNFQVEFFQLYLVFNYQYFNDMTNNLFDFIVRI